MSKSYSNCDRHGTCSHKTRNAMIAVAIVGLLLIGVAASSLDVSPGASGFTYTIGNENWEAQTSLHSGSVAGQLYTIPSVVNPATLPSYVMGTPTSSNLQIDPDWEAGERMMYVGANGAMAPNDGPQPKVIMSLSQVVPTDYTGQPLSSPVPAKEWDDTTGATPLHWYQYYFYFEAEMKTESSKCDRTFGFMYPGDRIQNSYCGILYEYEAVPVTMQFSVDLMSIYQNASFQSRFADARVTYVKTGYIPNTVTINSFTTHDYAANAWNDLDENVKVNPTYDFASGTGTTGLSAILTLSGTLQSGVLFNMDGNYNWGIKMPVNTYLIYGVLLSVQVTRPLTQPPRPPEAGHIWIIDYLIAVIQNPEDPMFWVIILVIVVVLYLLFVRKKKPQTTNITVSTYSPSQPQQQSEPRKTQGNRRKRGRRAAA